MVTIRGQGVVSREAKQPAPVEEMTIDDPGPGEVLVRIRASGVCHTDLHVKMGTWDGFPFLLGHEGAGVVEKVGEGVTRPAVGDHVILAWRAPCGACRFCLVGQPHLCAASLNAEKLMEEARAEEAKLRVEIQGLKRLRRQLIEELRATVERYDRTLSAELGRVGGDVDKPS